MSDNKYFIHWDPFEKAVRDLAKENTCHYDITSNFYTKIFIAEVTNKTTYLYFRGTVEQMFQFADLVKEIEPFGSALLILGYLTKLRNLTQK